MKTLKVDLGTIEKVKNFVTLVSRYPYDFDLVSGRYTVDAKSIMGIFSLDLSRPIQLDVHGDVSAEFEAALKPFVTE